MSVDVTRFHSVFFEESDEAVTEIESGLLNLDVTAVDSEAINTIFRAAHSIKGGSATFGFQQVAAYTHVMENLLDDIRAGKRSISQDIVDVLLGSVDALRHLLTFAKKGEQMDVQVLQDYLHPLELIMSGGSAAPSPEAPADASSATQTDEDVLIGWRIVFTPHKEMMLRGNDPLRLIRELGEHGPLEVICDTAQMPEWELYEPLNSYLGWTLNLKAPVERAVIDDIFAWVEDECDLALVPILETSAPILETNSKVAEEKKDSPSPSQEVLEPAISTPEPVQDISPKKAPTAKSTATSSTESQSIRVDLGKVDALINMVGELVITQSMLNLLSEDEALQGMERLQQGLMQLHRQTRALQEGVMQIRMLPISFCFSRFPRMVRDLSRQLSKDIELVMSGESTEVDKTVIEKITDPLVHLVRNSVDHGIETVEERVGNGKPEHGTVWLRAYHQVGNIVIEVEDDGKGLDPAKLLDKAKKKGLISEETIFNDQQAFELIFLPGFSTKEQASDLSGRGVGMDVVKRNVQSLGGSIHVDSTLGKGTRFVIRLPLTLAIMDGQLVNIGEEIYVIPLVSIIESLQPYPEMVHKVTGTGEAIKLRGQYLPVLRLTEALDAPAGHDVSALENGIVVIVEHDNRRFGLFVDDLSSQQQIVIKSLEDNYHSVQGVSGATILGDGRVALILDVGGLAMLQKETEETYAQVG
ncbi:chemotaxis protein CheA [Hahella sp. CCB-MM4]|uniref:chemotaxis protein CheA n=1 Tax=Hahella sp. (strain CCB-MM4) TaxID=1926491 RepID=UPI000B9B932D|nr:chemotaxis protein CheA [Hahella sp. CCB-MM4]OZG75291.1 chemotaxis protein CheA [Hahella sp. CCB-MM4]